MTQSQDAWKIATGPRVVIEVAKEIAPIGLQSYLIDKFIEASTQPSPFGHNSLHPGSSEITIKIRWDFGVCCDLKATADVSKLPRRITVK
jgi:hypothetical protein